MNTSTADDPWNRHQHRQHHVRSVPLAARLASRHRASKCSPGNCQHVEHDHEEAAYRRQQLERQRQKDATKGKGLGDGEMEVWVYT
ncbi:hypothetical protein TB2_026666 [Malus domestica]